MNAHNVKVTRDAKRWEVEVTAEIPVEVQQRFRAEALKDLGKNVHLKGFRPGHAPETELIRALGEPEVRRRAAEMAVRDTLPELLAAEKLNVVDTPQVSIDTLSDDAPLTFTARAPLAPEITLPDYKKIAAEKNAAKPAVTLSDKEYDETVVYLRRERARMEKIDAGVAPQQAAEEAQSIDEKDLPSLDDAFVKTLGAEDLAQFSEKLREQLLHEKTMQENAKHRTTLLDALTEKAKISYPIILQEYELDDIEARLADDLGRIGRTLEQYLEETKKDRDALRAEWKEAADKRVKIRLALGEIARKEHIDAPAEQVEHELEHAKKQYPQAAPEALRAHIAHALRNESTLSWLEAQ
jgi:FKBP-type peptidyl-prolyl cis-trans isomerase (trigger factor)